MTVPLFTVLWFCGTCIFSTSVSCVICGATCGGYVICGATCGSYDACGALGGKNVIVVQHVIVV